uniref:Beta/alpha-defensin C-terminal domain-containing protein n=1 Tax=Crocodylus porosus TaxID=8502 RepID=A0A7M4E198_CROPO
MNSCLLPLCIQDSSKHPHRYRGSLPLWKPHTQALLFSMAGKRMLWFAAFLILLAVPGNAQGSKHVCRTAGGQCRMGICLSGEVRIGDCFIPVILCCKKYPVRKETGELQGANGSYYSTLQCRNNHGHCRRLCFHGEQWIGNCNGRHQHCCK